jgi:putative spermidine/putrescine transport system permease protein
MIVVLVLLLLPMAVVIPSAFGSTTQVQFPPKGFTVDWFREVLGSEFWRSAFYKSVRVGLATAVLATGLGLALARFGTTLKSRSLRASLQVAVLTPVVVPVILLAIGTFDVQTRLGLLGSDVGLVLAHSVICLPLTFLITANALARVDPSLEEAAWSVGVRPLRAFWTITMPVIRPAVMSSLLIAFMTSWDEAVIALLQVGLDKTLPVNFYSMIRSGVSPAVAAVAVLLMVPVFVGMTIVAISSLRQARSAAAGADEEPAG